MITKNTKIALMWRGDPRAPNAPTRHEERLQPVFDALRGAGFAPEPVIYLDECAEAVRTRLMDCGGVLVWINPIADGLDRRIVDQVLRDVAARGVWVSAHPDVIDKMGVKTVLFATRDLSWGSDTDVYGSLADFDARFEANARKGARVIKPNRGNDGQGVLKVMQRATGGYELQNPSDDARCVASFAELRVRLQFVFNAGHSVIDQEFHPITEVGMVRCYMTGSRVIGFGLQRPRTSSANALGMKSEKTMHDNAFAPLSDLRRLMEHDWTPAMQRLLQLTDRELPALWDADFLFREPVAGRDRFALCEINVSCVTPFPVSVPAAISEWVSGLSLFPA